MDEIRCPICCKPLRPPTVAAHPHFPFCSKRCQLVDLSRWMDGSYLIEGAAQADPEDEQADPPPAG